MAAAGSRPSASSPVGRVRRRGAAGEWRCRHHLGRSDMVDEMSERRAGGDARDGGAGPGRGSGRARAGVLRRTGRPEVREQLGMPQAEDVPTRRASHHKRPLVVREGRHAGGPLGGDAYCAYHSRRELTGSRPPPARRVGRAMWSLVDREVALTRRSLLSWIGPTNAGSGRRARRSVRQPSRSERARGWSARRRRGRRRGHRTPAGRSRRRSRTAPARRP